jgi:hypothetical protein
MTFHRQSGGKPDIVLFKVIDTEMWPADRAGAWIRRSIAQGREFRFAGHAFRQPPVRMKNGELTHIRRRVQSRVSVGTATVDRRPEPEFAEARPLSEIRARQPQADSASPRFRAASCERHGGTSQTNAPGVRQVMTTTIFYMNIGDRFFRPTARNSEMDDVVSNVGIC